MVSKTSLMSLKWYGIGLAISLPVCFLLALGLSSLGLSTFKLSAVLIFSSAGFLALVMATAIAMRRAALPRARALEGAPEDVVEYYLELRGRLSAAIWAMVLLAISFLAITIAILFLF